MTLPRLDLAETSQRIETLKKDLGQKGEVRPNAESVQAFEKSPIRGIEIAVLAVSKQSVGREVIDVPHELLSIKIAQGAPSLGVHSRAPGSLILTLDDKYMECQARRLPACRRMASPSGGV
jgi:hypothetical protein